MCCTDAHHCSAKHICLMTSGQCKSVTLIVCAMLLQEHESKIAELDLSLKKEQEDKAAAIKVSAAQAALLPSGTTSHDHRRCY